MLLEELFNQLRYGELSHIKIGGKSAGEIKIERYPEMVTHFNQGLTRLHSRFLIREDELLLQEYEAISLYKLRPEFAVNSGSAEPVKYIIDTVSSPFLNNVLQVERAYNEIGEELPINDDTRLYSIYTPKYDVVQLTAPVDTNITTLIYRGNHPRLSATALDPTTQNIDIPEVLSEALLNFVAHRILAPLGGNEFGNASHEYLAKYEENCQQVEMYGLLNKDSTPSTKAEILGWV